MVDTTSELSPDFTAKSWMSDVTFLVEGKALYASKSVLALFSPVFNAMFGSHFKEREQQEIELPGKEYESFHEFLMCLYPNVQKQLNEKTVCTVLPLAHEYQCMKLIDQCKSCLKTMLDRPTSVENTVEILAVACAYNLAELKATCIKNISNLRIDSKTCDQLKEFGSMSQYKDVVICIQNEMLMMQFAKVNELQTEHAKICVRSDLTQNVADITDDFRPEKGVTLKLSIDNISKLLSDKVVGSSVEYLWDGIVRLAVIKHAENRSLSLSILFKLLDGTDKENWSSEMKVKLVLKNQHRGAKHKSFVGKSTATKTCNLILHRIRSVRELERSGLLLNDRLYLKAYVVAKEPVYLQR